MKNLNIFKAALVFISMLFFANGAFAQSACTTTSGASSGEECLLDVKSFKLKVYEFALCTGFATVAVRVTTPPASATVGELRDKVTS